MERTTWSRRGAGVVVAALAAGLAASGASASAADHSAPSAATTASRGATISPGSPVQHVVVILQENHSFDNVLGQLCVDNQTSHVRMSCSGYTGPVTFTDGKKAPNRQAPDIVPGISHDRANQLLALQNSWDKIGGCAPSTYHCVNYYTQGQIPNLAKYAKTYTVSDASFAENPAMSFGAHVLMETGTQDGFTGDNPIHLSTAPRGGPGVGCPSNRDALWNVAKPTYEPSCIPDQSGHGPYRSSPVPYVPTIMERIEQAGLSWHIYEGSSITDRPVNSLWSLCPYDYWCYSNRFKRAYDSSQNDFVTAAAAGTLPNLSLLMPLQGNSQHNAASMTVGDNYIGKMVSAAMNGPEWSSTAIFITYDDCGCFYDHITPPPGMGVRLPMVIVSPWARPGYTDSTVASQPDSVLAFVQHVFGLASFNPVVDSAYDYANSFNFAQPPLPAVRAVETPIAPAEQNQLAHTPLDPNDPT